MALAGDRLLARFLDDQLRLMRAELGAERHRHRLDHDQALRDVEIAAHALGIDLEPLRELGDGGERAGGDQQQRRDGMPLRLPAAEAALVLLHLAGDDGGEQVRRDGRGRDADGGGVGIALVRQVDGFAAVRARRLVRFADLGLHQQRDVARDLAAGAGEDRERGGDLGEPVAVGVPGRVRRRQVEQRGQPVGDREAVLAERRQRAGGAAELQRQRLLAQPAQPLARARQRRRIARELEPERHRQRVLQRGARHRGGAAMAAGDRA